MLELKGLKKDYLVGGDVGEVHALKGIDLVFRDTEFVSILGPSGCGKTTLLNIIGGLDHATEGDLVVDGIDTKDFKDSDWDSYRNHRIGFVFQSYNLIPHQTVYQNVELALTIRGVEREQRKDRVMEALRRVGLEGEEGKRPNQLSGGQCQRVAIARAIVGDPEILLADEPTGALDTETSVQIMEIIKEISKDRLVIMVTHNPDLAERYSTRIVRLLDGKVQEDSDPFDGNLVKEEPSAEETLRKSKLSFASAFRLSGQNLYSKRKRTSLVAIAASIGIIGVSSVLAISSGVTGYIDNMEADMLSGNPIAVEAQGIDLSSLMNLAGSLGQIGAVVEGTEEGYVNVNETITALVNSAGEVNEFMFSNEITPEYLEYVKAMDEEYYAGIVFDYGIDVSTNIYVESNLQGLPYEMPGYVTSLQAIRTVYRSILAQTEFTDYADYVNMLPKPFSLLPDSDELILSQYDILETGGEDRLPKAEDEIAIVLGNDALSDLTLAETGYLSQEEFLNNVYQAIGSDLYDPELEKNRFSYEELMSKEFLYYPNDSIFTRYEATGSSYDTVPSFVYSPNKDSGREEESLSLKVTAILRKKEGVNYGCLNSGLYYTSAFQDRVRDDAKDSEVVRYVEEKGQDGLTSKDPAIYPYQYTFEGQLLSSIGYLQSFTEQTMLEGATGAFENMVLVSLNALGGGNTPLAIEIYPNQIEGMDKVKEYLDAWNGDGTIVVGDKELSAEDRPEIRYTDSLSIVLAMVNSLIDLITAALIIFTALSLVVSTVMIAVITYVSVIERVKEIGVIRSLGGRKKDVKRLFNAETFITGLLAGLIGILVTYLLQIILNLIVGGLSGIYTIAALPWWEAVVMVLLSVGLTLLSGLVPASLAAKKDPVVALRSE